ncbi:MAG: FAD-binding protein, partial [Aquificaceae bacterium]|nr:FAD-binding protein [Aquificaceae bacterium]
MSVKELRSLINGEVLSDEASLRLYSYDATPIKIERQTPLCVVLPTSEEDVINLVSYCYERNIPIFPRGAGSGLTGGAVPTQKGVVVSFERMNSLEIDKENAVAIAQPGVITSKLQEAAESVGLFYPPDPSSYKYSTIGGNVAENAGGPRCFKYGVTREYVLGLRAVIKEGKVLQTGAPVIKDVAGYDLTKFLVGSEGTLGLITSITLKLIPKPKARASALLIFDSISNLSEATTRIITGGLFPSALEFM